MENKYVSSSHTSASKGEGLALGTSKQVVQKAHKCRTCNKTFPTDQALGGHQTTHRPKPAQSATPKHEALMLSAEEARVQVQESWILISMSFPQWKKNEGGALVFFFFPLSFDNSVSYSSWVKPHGYCILIYIFFPNSMICLV